MGVELDQIQLQLLICVSADWEAPYSRMNSFLQPADRRTCSMMVFRLSVFWLSTLCFLQEVGALDRVNNITLPACRVLKASVDCPIPCWGNKWEVTLLMTGHNGTKVFPEIKMDEVALEDQDDIPHQGSYHDARDKNDILFIYSGSCCRKNVEVAAKDKQGNRGLCNFTIRHYNTTVTAETGHQAKSVRSNGPNITISLWTTSLLLALAAPLL